MRRQKLIGRKMALVLAAALAVQGIPAAAVYGEESAAAEEMEMSLSDEGTMEGVFPEGMEDSEVAGSGEDPEDGDIQTVYGVVLEEEEILSEEGRSGAAGIQIEAVEEFADPEQELAADEENPNAYVKATNEPYSWTQWYGEYDDRDRVRTSLTMYADTPMELELVNYNSEATVYWSLNAGHLVLDDAEGETDDTYDLKKQLSVPEDAASLTQHGITLTLRKGSATGTVIREYTLFVYPYKVPWMVYGDSSESIESKHFCPGDTYGENDEWEGVKCYSDAYHPEDSGWADNWVLPTSIRAENPGIVSFTAATDSYGDQSWTMTAVSPGTTAVYAEYVIGGDTYTRTLNITVSEHSWGEWTAAADPAQQQRTCSVCGRSETRTVTVEQPQTEAPAQETLAAEAPSFTISGLPNGKVQWSGDTLVLSKKQSITLTAFGVTQGDSIVSWTSSNKKAATVSKTGKVTAKSTGSTTLTATYASGRTTSIKVNVQKKAVTTKKITVNTSKKMDLKSGKKFTLKTSLTPVTTVDKVKFTSSNKKVATVSAKGVIQGKKKGTASVTVQSGKKKVKIKVNVK